MYTGGMTEITPASADSIIPVLPLKSEVPAGKEQWKKRHFSLTL